MGQPLIGKRSIMDFFGTGWTQVSKYISQGAPIVRGQGVKSPYESDQGLLEKWWEKYIKEKVGANIM